MIQLLCNQCQTMLEIDDGFAGGACRCRHCGAIQTVPSHLKNKESAARPGRVLYQNTSRINSGDPNLEKLADVVASSGLRSARLRKPLTIPPAQNDKVKPLVIFLVSIIAILSAVLIFLLIHRPT